MQLEPPNTIAPSQPLWPPGVKPPSCGRDCPDGRAHAGRVCAYQMMLTPIYTGANPETGRKEQRTKFAATAIWFYYDQHGCLMPPPRIAQLQRPIAHVVHSFGTKEPYTYQKMWPIARIRLEAEGAPPPGTHQPFGSWLESLARWSSPPLEDAE